MTEIKQSDKNFLDDIYDTLMKNTQYKVRDFTKYKNVYAIYKIYTNNIKI